MLSRHHIRGDERPATDKRIAPNQLAQESKRVEDNDRYGDDRKVRRPTRFITYWKHIFCLATRPQLARTRSASAIQRQP